MGISLSALDDLGCDSEWLGDSEEAEVLVGPSAAAVGPRALTCRLYILSSAFLCSFHWFSPK